jgi:hypothetical protein
MSLVLLACGAAAIAIGLWRGYVAARGALAPLAHDGDPTRAAIESSRPWTDRPRVRAFARNALVSIGWITVAMYGLFLVSASQAAAS